jgi:hypothetical protein
VGRPQHARLLRFHAVAEAMRAGQVAHLGWVGPAAAGGYADQSHLHREFRALAGLTPAEALRDWTAVRPTPSWNWPASGCFWPTNTRSVCGGSPRCRQVVTCRH